MRLITLDRPGYGGSEPGPHTTVLGFVEDVLELLDHLTIDTCAVVGWSGGGRYALACGRTAPHRTPEVGTIASPGPVDEMPRAQGEMPEEMLTMRRRAREGDPTLAADAERIFSRYADDPTMYLQLALDNPDDPDRSLFLQPEIAATMTTMWEEGARQGTAGYVSDWLAQAGGWGFSLQEIETPVHVWHGDADVIVPHHHAEHLAANLPNADLTTYPGEGHLIAIPHWSSILDTLV